MLLEAAKEREEQRLENERRKLRKIQLLMFNDETVFNQTVDWDLNIGDPDTTLLIG